MSDDAQSPRGKSPRKSAGSESPKAADEAAPAGATPETDEPAPAETAPRPRGRDDQNRLSPALIATLVAIPVMVLAGFITFAAVKSSRAPEVPVENYALAVDGPDAAEVGQCEPFLAALPEQLGDFGGKKVDGRTVRWSKDDTTDQVVLRCGVQRPKDFAPTSSLQVIDLTQWFITETQQGVGQAYVAVDHRPYVALWLPSGSGSAPISDISAAINEHLTAGPLDFG